MDVITLLAIASAGAVASPLGGAVAVWKRPTTLALSVSVGFASGALIGTFAFEMLPKAAETTSLATAIGGLTKTSFEVNEQLDWFSRNDI